MTRFFPFDFEICSSGVLLLNENFSLLCFGRVEFDFSSRNDFVLLSISIKFEHFSMIKFLSLSFSIWYTKISSGKSKHSVYTDLLDFNDLCLNLLSIIDNASSYFETKIQKKFTFFIILIVRSRNKITIR